MCPLGKGNILPAWNQNFPGTFFPYICFSKLLMWVYTCVLLLFYNNSADLVIELTQFILCFSSLKNCFIRKQQMKVLLSLPCRWDTYVYVGNTHRGIVYVLKSRCFFFDFMVNESHRTYDICPAKHCLSRNKRLLNIRKCSSLAVWVHWDQVRCLNKRTYLLWRVKTSSSIVVYPLDNGNYFSLSALPCCFWI